MDEQSHTVPKRSKTDAQPPPSRSSAIAANNTIAPSATNRQRTSRPLYTTAAANTPGTAVQPPVFTRGCVAIEEVPDEDATSDAVEHERAVPADDETESFDIYAVTTNSENESEIGGRSEQGPSAPSANPGIINSAAYKV